MKTNFCISVLYFSMILFLSACAIATSEHGNVAPTEVTKTSDPDIQIQTATIVPTNTPNLNIISSSSPNNKYTIELKLDETPIKLTILNSISKQEIQIPISYGYYNKIVEGDGFRELKWSVDSKLLMFVLHREPNPEKAIEISSCFFVVDIEQAKLLKVNCSTLGVHIWTPDESGIITLETGGLNDIFDYYLPGTNCYKDTPYSECAISYTSPSGIWELSPWEEANVTLKSLHGNIWKYSYPVVGDQPDFIFTTVQGWSSNENYVLFSPSFSDSRVYGLFQMDLRNGNVISLLENKAIDQQTYFLSVSPSTTKAIYISSDGRGFIKDLIQNTEKHFKIQIGKDEAIANFVWSPNETIAVFAKFKYGKENEIVSADYFRLDLENSQLITVLKNESEYLNIIKMTNSEVIIGQDTYSLMDGTLLK